MSYQKTKVLVKKTQADIGTLLSPITNQIKFMDGATSIRLDFLTPLERITIEVPLSLNPKKNKRKKDPELESLQLERLKRSAWRSIYWLLKSTMDTHEKGIIIMQDELRSDKTTNRFPIDGLL